MHTELAEQYMHARIDPLIAEHKSIYLIAIRKKVNRAKLGKKVDIVDDYEHYLTEKGYVGKPLGERGVVVARQYIKE